MLLGYNSNQDLDKLVLKLEENHDLLTDMVVREESSDISSALPKLILDLLNQTADETKNENSTEEINDTASISGDIDIFINFWSFRKLSTIYLYF